LPPGRLAKTLMVGKSTMKIFDVKEIVPTENILKSGVSFEADAELVYKAITTADTMGLEIVGMRLLTVRV
jgi:hypothetical protein